MVTNLYLYAYILIYQIINYSDMLLISILPSNTPSNVYYLLNIHIVICTTDFTLYLVF